MRTAFRYVSAPRVYAALALAVCIAFVTDSVAHTRQPVEPHGAKASADDKYNLKCPTGLPSLILRETKTGSLSPSVRPINCSRLKSLIR
jgi:hypothetical protein